MPGMTLLSRTFLASLALLLAAAAGAAALQGDEVVDEFQKYFRKYKDTPTRVEAVLALEGTESARVVSVLVPVLKLDETDVVRAAVRVLGKFKTRPPVDALFAELVASKDELVRVGLLQAISLGKYSGGTEALTELLADKSWEVRRRAIEALASGGDPAVAASIQPLAADKEPAVRSAAFEGLAALRSELAVAPAIAALADPVWQVRASAIGALRVVRHRDAIEPLIARMALEEGRLVADIGDALGAITGRNFGQRLELWQHFWTTYRDRFQIPTEAELAKLREKQKQTAEQYKASKQTTYHGIETPSRRIVFVIDVSGSMENLVVEKERFQDGGYPSMLRIDIVKTELARTIESLEDYVEFNVFAFATAVKPWKSGLVKANVLNKSSAMDWVKRLAAIGGASKEDLAQAGLTGAANLDAGKTNTHGALMAALGVPARGGTAADYAVEVDTIFFLSDGRPTVGEYVDPTDVLRQVREANALRKVVIHAIAIGEFQKEFMKQLAEENGGVFVDLGR
jgi:HEAT repeat protein